MDNEIEFRDYLKQTKNQKGNSFGDSRINKFINILKNIFPQKLNELGENIDSLLKNNDLVYLERLKRRCLQGGDLHSWNQSIDTMEPSSALLNYMNFLFYKNNGQIIDPLPINLSIKNIILYGAPGVGKTHNYKNLISMIEEGKSQKEIFETISKNLHVSIDNENFEKIKNEKRVEFVTFHQSYSYEDFIEGYRPNESGTIELEDGIFKNLCNKALSNSNKSISNEKLIFIDALNLLLKDKIENEETVRINLRRDNSFFDIYDYDKRSVYYTRQGQERDKKYHTLSIKTLEHMYNNEENNIISGGLKTYYEPLLLSLMKIGKEKKIEKVEEKNFYIVIDEINRGNISKIFGELITLIEEEKRNKYEITLPYSKEPFKVPSNLYIIATMNSTDKSIATIDIALRRRFTFLKMRPNLELVSDKKAKEFMQILNQYIAKKLGEDYMLGHSYFMGDIDLDFVKEYKIKPLLEEYFYADEKSPDKIISAAFNEVKKENKVEEDNE
jgi:5-methylcytosine-specific restriction protein B